MFFFFFFFFFGGGGDNCVELLTYWILHSYFCFLYFRFLATGESFHSLSFRFRMGYSTVRTIVKDTVIFIWNKLQAREMPIPNEQKWISIADKFFARCDYPSCLGAIDGKHIKIKAPPNSGSKYYNYKGHHSVVLLAIADADCRYIIVDVGAYGSNSDGGIIQDSAFTSCSNQTNSTFQSQKPYNSALGFC